MGVVLTTPLHHLAYFLALRGLQGWGVVTSESAMASAGFKLALPIAELTGGYRVNYAYARASARATELQQRRFRPARRRPSLRRARPGPDRVLEQFAVGRELMVSRLGPWFVARTPYLMLQMLATLPVRGPDQLSFYDGMGGTVSFRYSGASDESAPAFP
jgi:hypothetical protein